MPACVAGVCYDEFFKCVLVGRQEYESEEDRGDAGSDGSEEGDDEEEEGSSVPPVKEKKLDDDEDRRNPQYIPKRGTFYEHDDRTADYDDG